MGSESVSKLVGDSVVTFVYGTTREDTDYSIIKAQARCMLDDCCYRHTDTRSELYLLPLYDNNGYANAPECYFYTNIACILYTTEQCR